MTIVLFVEGKTETALREHLKSFLDRCAAAEGRPKVALRTKPLMTTDARELAKCVRLELAGPSVSHVVGLVDVYPCFSSAEEAKRFQREAAGDNPQFTAHAAQYEVEAWVLPYWDDVCRKLKVKRAAPGPCPEHVDLDNPPSRRLAELYRTAGKRTYRKAIEMAAILRGKDLTIAAEQCPEFKSFLNTLLKLGGLRPL